MWSLIFHLNAVYRPEPKPAEAWVPNQSPIWDLNFSISCELNLNYGPSDANKLLNGSTIPIGCWVRDKCCHRQNDDSPNDESPKNP